MLVSWRQCGRQHRRIGVNVVAVASLDHHGVDDDVRPDGDADLLAATRKWADGAADVGIAGAVVLWSADLNHVDAPRRDDAGTTAGNNVSRDERRPGVRR